MLEEIQAKIRQGEYEFSRHAVDQSIIRRISVLELTEAIAHGEIIETYADDKYGPSCLVFGMTNGKKPLHVQCSYPTRDLVKIITVYEPDPEQWVEFRKRKK